MIAVEGCPRISCPGRDALQGIAAYMIFCSIRGSSVEFGDDAADARHQNAVKCNARTPRLLGVFA